MATEIREIPTLEGKDAQVFIEKAEHVRERERASVDFSKQSEIGKEILAKAKID